MKYFTPVAAVELLGHSPHGECGLKFHRYAGMATRRRHSPHGECGLKYHPFVQIRHAGLSLPARGVWVEISGRTHILPSAPVTPRTGSVG